jgi:hypothetical protein
MDDISSEDALAIAQATQRSPSPQRPRRGTKAPGFYKPVNPLRPVGRSRSNIMPKDKAPKDKAPKDKVPKDKDKGKRKRVGSPTSGDEDGQGEHGGSSGSGNGEDNGNGKDGGDGKDNGKGKGDGKSSTKAKPTQAKKVKAKKEEEEEVRERTPPSETEARPIQKDRDLKITGDGPKMEEGDAPRYYAKVSRVVEVSDYNGKNPVDKTIEENYRMPNHPPVLLPEVDLGLLKTRDCTHIIPDREIVRFAMEAGVLPLLKQWAYMWLNPDNESKQFHEDMQRTFSMDGEHGKPWKVGINLVAEHEGLTYHLAPLLYRMSKFAQRLVNANGAFFNTFSAYSRATNEQHKFAARLLLIVWEDVEKNENGFFRILFKGELARPNRPEMRELYEGWYVVDERLYS